MPPVDVLHLPKLGQTLSTADAEPETEEFLINRACTRPVLADRLKHYGFQGISGWKRDKLIAKLTEYANDRTQWKGQFVPAKNQSRGKFSGASSKRGTAKRSRAMLDGDDDALDQEGFVSKYPAQGFEDTRTAQDIKTLRHLADLVVAAPTSMGEYLHPKSG
ncbi:hypothetical protein OF83DRAFT_772713 [Amylostereum chailletii]|nr:hypothetical protein OF83DRAFT_772713 [Amylostereum chailletii]